MTVGIVDFGESTWRQYDPGHGPQSVGKRSDRVKKDLTTTGLAGLAVLLLGIVVVLQLTVHDPRHVLLTVVASWGLLSLPVALLFGHFSKSGEDRNGRDD
jgi:hypothetical protein